MREILGTSETSLSARLELWSTSFAMHSDNSHLSYESRFSCVLTFVGGKLIMSFKPRLIRCCGEDVKAGFSTHHLPEYESYVHLHIMHC